VQLVQGLPYKHEALSSNPDTARKKKKPKEEPKKKRRISFPQQCHFSIQMPIFSFLARVVLGFELSVPHLLVQCSLTWAMATFIFTLASFPIGSSHFALVGLDHNHPICTTLGAGVTDVCHHTQHNG
jgi:hypothetical protein